MQKLSSEVNFGSKTRLDAFGATFRYFSVKNVRETIGQLFFALPLGILLALKLVKNAV